MQKITMFLMYNDQAEEAMNFYASIFKNARIVSTIDYGEAGPGMTSNVSGGTLEIEGQQFMAMNGGPHFTFEQGMSLFVDCKTQEEIDELWEKLSAGGEKEQCGWVKDKFGVSWQIVPSVLGELLGDEDPAKAKRVMDAMLKMGKLDIATLQRAYEG